MEQEALQRVLPYLIGVNLVVVFGVLLFVLRREGRGLRDIGWVASPRGRGVAHEVALGVAFALLLYLFKETVFDSLMAVLGGNRPTFTSLFRFRIEAAELPLLVVAGTLIVVEESVYRGYGLTALLSRWGTVASFAMMAVLFGLLHAGRGPAAFVYSAGFGVAFGAIFLWRRTLLTGIVAHALYNIMVILT